MTLSVINNAFVNVCREMGTAMMRTSYSPIFNEGLDFSCMLFNLRGDLIGQAEFCPTMLGSCQYAMKWMLDEVGLDAFGPGDVFIHNDPYRGQCHMPEHLVVKAVFHEGQPWGFVGNIAHVGEIGGMAPGSFAADATEVYQEGLRLPPLKIMDGGEYVKDVWRIVLANHRTPKTTWGDYHAMIGSLHVAEVRVQELLAKYGAQTLTHASDQLLDYSERFMRAEIAEMPDGVYYAQDQMEDDGVTSRPYWMRLRLTIRGDEAICDWTDSDEQAKGPINATFVVTAASCYSGFLNVVSDDIPINSGCLPADSAGDPARDVSSTSSTQDHRSAATPRRTRISRTSSSGRWPGPCRSGSPPPRARPLATSCLVAFIPSMATTTRTTTSKGAAGAAPSTTTATAYSVRTTATAATRRSRSWRRNTRSLSRSTGCAQTRRGPGAGAVGWPAPAPSA